jgi:hypothetical protein
MQIKADVTNDDRKSYRVHSDRSDVIGSARVARWAGSQQPYEEQQQRHGREGDRVGRLDTKENAA